MNETYLLSANNSNLFFIYDSNLSSIFVTVKYIFFLNISNFYELIYATFYVNEEILLLKHLELDLINNLSINKSILWDDKWYLFNWNDESHNYIEFEDSENIIDNIFINILIALKLKENTMNFYLSLNNLELTENLYLFMPKILNFIILLYLTAIGFILISSSYLVNDRDSIETSSMITDLLMQSDKEIGAFEDLLNTLVIIACIFCGFTCQFILLKAIVAPNINLSLLAIVIFIGILMLNLIFLLWDLGARFLIFLRGGSKTESHIYELLLDYVFLASFFMRTLIQNMRIFIVIISYFSYIHTIESYSPDIFLFNLDLSILNNSSTNSSTNILVFFFKMFFLITFELAHSMITMTSQFMSFFSIIFWVFNSLYFTHEENKSEIYFTLKKIV